jgi:sugar/nucleoside kinase (ribokinase family)
MTVRLGQVHPEIRKRIAPKRRCAFRDPNQSHRRPARTRQRLGTRYNQAMSLVVVGSVAYDAIETPYGKRERTLGGACTYIALSASYFTKVSIVAVIGDDFAREDHAFLASRNIDLEGLEQAPGKTFFWSGVYSADMNDRTTLQTDLNVFADFKPKLPESYKDDPYLLLGNIQPELQKNVHGQMKQLRFAGGDTMNFWIESYRDQLVDTIRDWDFLLINDSEARMLAGENNLRKAANKILDMGPNTLVIKRGEYGALLFRRDTLFMVPGYLLEEVFDPTGAGDCFAGGFVGYLAECGCDLKTGHIDIRELHRAVIYGSVMGSLCCEKFGVDRFRTLTRPQINQRFEEFRRFTAF